MLLWRGLGTTGSPDPKHMDRQIGLELQKHGFKGSRDGRICTYVALNPYNAMDYAIEPTPEYLKQIKPHKGSIISWCHGEIDLVMSFNEYFTSLYWDGRTLGSGRTSTNIYNLIKDCQGDIETLNTYLTLNRQKRAISIILQDFITTLSPKEIVYENDTQLKNALGSHTGELWITGGVDTIDVNLQNFPDLSKRYSHTL